MKKVSIYFKIKDNNGKIHNSANYSISELIKMTEEDIFENMEVCNCSLNESSNHCEGDCVKFDSGEIVGYEIVSESPQPSAPSVSADFSIENNTSCMVHGDKMKLVGQRMVCDKCESVSAEEILKKYPRHAAGGIESTQECIKAMQDYAQAQQGKGWVSIEEQILKIIKENSSPAKSSFGGELSYNIILEKNFKKLAESIVATYQSGSWDIMECTHPYKECVMSDRVNKNGTPLTRCSVCGNDNICDEEVMEEAIKNDDIHKEFTKEDMLAAFCAAEEYVDFYKWLEQYKPYQHIW